MSKWVEVQTTITKSVTYLVEVGDEATLSNAVDLIESKNPTFDEIELHNIFYVETEASRSAL